MNANYLCCDMNNNKQQSVYWNEKKNVCLKVIQKKKETIGDWTNISGKIIITTKIEQKKRGKDEAILLAGYHKSLPNGFVSFEKCVSYQIRIFTKKKENKYSHALIWFYWNRYFAIGGVKETKQKKIPNIIISVKVAAFDLLKWKHFDKP